MASPSVTRASLLLRIRDAHDRIAWGEFVELYAPLIHAYGMRRGLQDADAAVLVQDVLRRVHHVVPQFDYDPNKGSFRRWLLTITRNELRTMVARGDRQAIGSGDTQTNAWSAETTIADPADDELWNREYSCNLFHWAAERVKSEFRHTTWQAFWSTVVENNPIVVVATKLGISSGAIYIARSRVAARIRQEITAAEQE